MKTENTGIWNQVKALMYEHDCVIIPGFGGFVCNVAAAKIDQVSHVISPPMRHVIFNQNLKTNDGLLASRVATDLKITYLEAIKIIEETVAKTIEILQDKKMLSIDSLGNFRLNADANYVFLPDKQNNFSYASFGLMPLQAIPVGNRSIRVPKSKIFKDRKNLRTKKERFFSTKVVTTVLVIFTALVAINFYVLMNGSSFRTTNSTLNISSWFDSVFKQKTEVTRIPEKPKQTVETKKEEFIPPPPVAIDTVQTVISNTNKIDSLEIAEQKTEFDLISFAEHLGTAKVSITFSDSSIATEVKIIPEENPVVETKSPEITTNVKPITPALHGDSVFYIIGGVFCVEQNAIRFFHTLSEKGFSPEITTTKLNCHRVSYAKFSNRNDAVKELQHIQAEVNNEAWLFIRHN